MYEAKAGEIIRSVRSVKYWMFLENKKSAMPCFFVQAQRIEMSGPIMRGWEISKIDFQT